MNDLSSELLRGARVVAVVLAAAVAGRAVAADAPLELKWAALVPTGVAAEKPKTFFAGSEQKPDDNTPPPPPLPEGQFMSMKRRQPGGDRPPAVVAELNGKKVKIGGYVVPLDFDQSSVREFLLVPFVGACIHVPPPPTNQIIYVKASEAFEIGGAFDPVSVTGTIKTETAFTGLADAGYRIDADTVEPMKP